LHRVRCFSRTAGFNSQWYSVRVGSGGICVAVDVRFAISTAARHEDGSQDVARQSIAITANDAFHFACGALRLTGC